MTSRFPSTPDLPTEVRVERLNPFLAPNEHNIDQIGQFLPDVRRELDQPVVSQVNLVSVGTERVWMEAALYGHQINQIVGVDIDPSTYLYNLLNLALIAVCPTRDEYVGLRTQIVRGDTAEFQARLARADLSPEQRAFYASHLPAMQSCFQFAHADPKMRALDLGAMEPMGRRRAPVPEKANYLYTDAAYDNVRRMVTEERISFAIGSIDDLSRHWGRWRSPELRCVVDTSNVSSHHEIDQSLELPPHRWQRTTMVCSHVPPRRSGNGYAWTYYEVPAISASEWQALKARQTSLCRTHGLPTDCSGLDLDEKINDVYIAHGAGDRAAFVGSAPVTCAEGQFPTNSPQGRMLRLEALPEVRAARPAETDPRILAAAGAAIAMNAMLLGGRDDGDFPPPPPSAMQSAPPPQHAHRSTARAPAPPPSLLGRYSSHERDSGRLEQVAEHFRKQLSAHAEVSVNILNDGKTLRIEIHGPQALQGTVTNLLRQPPPYPDARGSRTMSR